ncbi:hypothetical protein [Kribbella sp. NPDC051620]|uniref:hypothetical protein n=1 Tax=Kribbella sp. NPDC051620 TaxID=3364120 RepID=UPI00378A2845
MLAVRVVQYDEPTHVDLDWLREVPGYRTASPADVQRNPRSYYPPIVAMWIGNRYGLAFTNSGDEIWIRSVGQIGGTTLGEMAPYPAVLYAWLSRHPQTPLPEQIQIRWLNNRNLSNFVKLEVVRTPFDRLFAEVADDPQSGPAE